MPGQPVQTDGVRIKDLTPSTIGASNEAIGEDSGQLVLADDILYDKKSIRDLSGVSGSKRVTIVGTGTDEAKFSSIQDAVDYVEGVLIPGGAASTANQATIYVLSGLYDGQVVVSNDGVNLVGVGNPRVVNTGGGSVFVIGSNEAFVIDGFRISSADAAATVAVSSDTGAENKVIKNCTISNAVGHAVSVDEADITIDSCTLSSIEVVDSSPVVTKCTVGVVVINTVSIAPTDCSPRFSDCVISGADSVTLLQESADTPITPFFENCSISGTVVNVTSSFTGPIGTEDIRAIFTSCIFESNTDNVVLGTQVNDTQIQEIWLENCSLKCGNGNYHIDVLTNGPNPGAPPNNNTGVVVLRNNIYIEDDVGYPAVGALLANVDGAVVFDMAEIQSAIMANEYGIFDIGSASSSYLRDSGGLFAATNVEDALSELATFIGLPASSVLLVAAGPVVLTGVEKWVICNHAAPLSITMPITAAAPRQIVIKDKSGSANTNNITVSANVGQTIDGLASFVMSSNYGAISLVWDGVGVWNIT